MTAIRATFDGSRVILPAEASDHRPGRVIVIFEDPDLVTGDFPAAAQQASFAKVWDNADDEIYDHL